MCMKGKAAPELVHSPHRLQYPMRRTRPKGDADPGWVRISWDEALAETARRLTEFKQESGAESVVFAVTTPSGTPLSDSIDWIERFVRLYGSPNICYGTEICNWHKDFAHAFTFGCGMPVADYAQADLILLWGHNPANTWLAQAHAIGAGRARGARMVVVDPRPTALALQADAWLPVRPGTDAALALGLINNLILTNRFDQEFVRQWTTAPFLVRSDNGCYLREQDLWPTAPLNRYVVSHESTNAVLAYDPESAAQRQGADQFKLRGTVAVDLAGGVLECMPAFELLARASAEYDFLTVQRITGVAQEPLDAVADLLASSQRIAYHSWTGIGQHTNATQSERAVATLYALCGSFDERGGNRVLGGPAFNAVNSLELLPLAQRVKALGLSERPIGPPAQGWVTARDTYRAILEGRPYRVRAMMAFGTNLVVSQADTALGRSALQALEFYVHCDLFENPSAKYADILLPINTPWEREGLRIGFEINDRAASLVQLRQRMVSPRAMARSDTDVVFDLACRMGMDDAFFGGSLESGWNYMLAPLGLTVQALRERPEGIECPIDWKEKKYTAEADAGVTGFATETRRVELYSELLLRHGQPPLPTFIEPAESPQDSLLTEGEHHPYVLSSAKSGIYCHSQHRSLPSLRKRAPNPVAELSPALAAVKHIVQGDWIRISTRLGQARFVARITPSLPDNAVVAEYGWWQSCPELGQDGPPADGQSNSNFNNLISADACDPVSGSVAHRSFLCDVERDTSVELRQRKWIGFKPFRVSALQKLAEGVIGIELETLDDMPLPDYLPGQHIEIRVSLAGKGILTRAYSLTGAADVAGRRAYRIAVRHQRGFGQDGSAYAGLVSTYLNSGLRVGDVIDLGGPSGSFVLPRAMQQPMVFYAGGIGITPFMSLLESLPDGAQAEICLYFANQNSTTHAFRERLLSHQTRLPNLRVINHYSAALPTEKIGTDYQTQKLVDARDLEDELIKRRARFYLCGPPAMMDAITAGLMARGVPRFDIFSEVFRSPIVPVIADGQQFKVTFARSGKQNLAWKPTDGTLLQFGESMGLSMPSGCRAGQCESCAVTLLSGSVRHLSGTDPEDPSACLTCQAVPQSDVVLDA